MLLATKQTTYPHALRIYIDALVLGYIHFIIYRIQVTLGISLSIDVIKTISSLR